MRAQYLLTIAVPENLKETVRSSSSCAEAIRELANRFEKKSEIESEVYKSLEAIPVLSNRPSVDEWKRYRDTILSTQRRATPFGEVMLNKVHTALSYGKLGPLYFQYMNRKHRETLPDLLKFTEDKIAMLEQMAKHRSQSVPASNNNSKPRQFATTAAIDSNSQVEPCAFCSEPHLRRNCPLSRSDRREALKRQNKCFGCFKSLKELPIDHRGNCAVSCKACRRRSMNT